MKSIWRRVLILAALVVIFETVLLYAINKAHADETPTPEIVVITMPPTPTPLPVTPPISTTATVIIEDSTTTISIVPQYDYPAEDARCLSRAVWSVCPENPTMDTRQAFMELVQNREDDDSGDFADGIRWILLQGEEFKDYDPDAYRSKLNNELADLVMREWIYTKVTGDRSYRLVPADGLYCDFYSVDGWDYIKVYNRAGDVVYDSGVTLP